MLPLGLDLEPIERVIPGGLEPRPELTQALGAGPVEALATLPGNGHHSRLLQHGQMLADGPEGDVAQSPVNVTGPGLAGPDQAENCPATGGGQRAEWGHDQY